MQLRDLLPPPDAANIPDAILFHELPGHARKA